MSTRPRSPSPRSFEDVLFHDPEESVLFRPFLGDALDPPQRTAALERYTAWLTERGDPAGEWLRLAALLGASVPPPGAEALRARFEELEQTLDPRWRACLLGRSWVLGCGEEPGLPPPVRFAYECERSWESFAPTETPGVRHCARCNQRVHACETRAEAEFHASQGHCISVSRLLARSAADRLARHVTGRPHIPSRWASEIFGQEIHAPRKDR